MCVVSPFFSVPLQWNFRAAELRHQVTRTLEPPDELGTNIARGLSDRLAVARAKSSSKRLSDPKLRPTHVVRLSTGSGTLGKEPLEREEDDNADEQGPASMIKDACLDIGDGPESNAHKN